MRKRSDLLETKNEDRYHELSERLWQGRRLGLFGSGGGSREIALAELKQTSTARFTACSHEHQVSIGYLLHAHKGH